MNNKREKELKWQGEKKEEEQISKDTLGNQKFKILKSQIQGQLLVLWGLPRHPTYSFSYYETPPLFFFGSSHSEYLSCSIYFCFFINDLFPVFSKLQEEYHQCSCAYIVIIFSSYSPFDLSVDFCHASPSSLSSGFIRTSTKNLLPIIEYPSVVSTYFLLKISIHSSTSLSVFFKVLSYSFLSQYFCLQTHVNFSTSML